MFEFLAVLDIIKDLLQILGVTFTGIAVFVAINIQQKLSSNHVKTRQIDHICELIEDLNSSEILVTFCNVKDKGFSGTGEAYLLNIFEIATYELTSQKNLSKEFESAMIIFSKDSNQIVDLRNYINHPLTPRKIANELINFHNSFCNRFDIEALANDDKFVLVKSQKVTLSSNFVVNQNENGNFMQCNAFAFETWLNFKECSKTLKKTIDNWFSENGIKENNIREDFNKFGW